jgi:hypothetical protein
VRDIPYSIPYKTARGFLESGQRLPRFSFTNSENVVRVTPEARRHPWWSRPKVECAGVARNRRGAVGFSSAWFNLHQWQST